MSKKVANYIILVALVLVFAFITVCAFLNVDTASAMTVTTVFRSQDFFNNVLLYREPTTSNPLYFDLRSYISVWNIEFTVNSDSNFGFVLYSLDTNNNDKYHSAELTSRSYTDVSSIESYFYTPSSGSTRIMDYVLQFEMYRDTITNAYPTYLNVAYSPIATSPWNWTAKRFTADNWQVEYGNGIITGMVVASYTFGNDDYRFTFNYPCRMTDDFATAVDNGDTKVSTMYFSTDLQGGNQYQNGYNQGYLNGITQSNNQVDKSSASYKQGLIDGADGNNPYSFVALFGAIADSQLTFIDGLLGFDFLGFNLLTFFKVIITLGLVFAIFRIIKGGN